MARGQYPTCSTALRSRARSSRAMSGRRRSSAMLQRSTPLALPKGQLAMTFFTSPVLQEDSDVALLGK
eukprot:4065276-Amphidinium_carterae.1